MSFRPLYDHVLVKRVKSAEKSAGGLYIPETAKEKPTEALVVAVGPGQRLEDGSSRAPRVSSGDRVIFGKYSGDEIKLDGETHMILRETEILAVLEN
jgi:chaperonin GroES